MNATMLSGYIKFQAKYDLGKSNAGLLLLAKGLYQEKCISKQEFDRLEAHYTRPLTAEPEDNRPLTPELLVVKQKLAEKKRQFAMVLEQWSLDHKSGWKETWLREAEQYPDIPEAQQILAKYVECRR
jgi:hypothetical protein